MPAPSRRAALVAAACVGVAAASLLLPWTLDYDPWAWSVWGREVATGALDTTAGPAWKPLPVLVTAAVALVAPGAVPAAWLVVARAAGVLAVVAAAHLAGRLAGRSPLSGVIAAAGILAVPGFARGVLLGNSEATVVALGLLAVERHLRGRRRQAVALGAAASLLRVEVWPLLVVYGLACRRREPPLGPWLFALGGAVAALWFLPELWGSGDLLRSSARARIPNPGAPALADRPSLEVLARFAGLAAVPLAAAVPAVAVALRRRDRTLPALAAVAGAWVAIVAAMSEAGYSGEERYLLPAVAATWVVAGAGAGRLVRGRAAAVAAVAVVGVAAVAVAGAAPRIGRHLDHAVALREHLAAVVRATRDGPVLCGALAAGRYRFPIVAWHLGVPISALALHPTAPGTILRSPLEPGSTPEPAVPAEFRRVAAHGLWEIDAAC